MASSTLAVCSSTSVYAPNRELVRFVPVAILDPRPADPGARAEHSTSVVRDVRPYPDNTRGSERADRFAAVPTRRKARVCTNAVTQ
jgi:hypothetical protein